MKFMWEEIYEIDNVKTVFKTARAKVFGGWLITNTWLMEKNNSNSTAMTFIPDPNHEWSIDE